jgi:hypothetical protein
MVSILWVAVAFVAGSVAGLLVFALMAMAAREDGRAASAERMLAGESLGGTTIQNWGG